MIVLTDEQTELLIQLVEETRRISGGQQYEFYAYRTPNGDFIIQQSGAPAVFFPDIYELGSERAD